MRAVTFRPESTARGWFTPSNPGPEGELRSRQFRAELTAEGPWLDEYGHSADIDRANEAPDEFEARCSDATLDELPEFEVQTWEDKTAAAAYLTGL